MGLWVYTTTPVTDRSSYVHMLPDHLAYQKSLEEKGVLLAAGPLLGPEGEKTGRGLIVVEAENFEAAREIADGDPLHKAGHRTYILEAWTPKEGVWLHSGDKQI